MKNNRDRSCNGILLKKQIGRGNRDGRNQSTKIHFDSPVKNFKKKLKEKESYLDLEIEISGEQNLKQDYCLFWEKAGEVSYLNSAPQRKLL